MANPWVNQLWNGSLTWRTGTRLKLGLAIALVVFAPVLTIATYLALQPIRGDSSLLRWVLLADLIYVLTLAALVLSRIARMVTARRARSAGSRLHLRLTAVFSIVALVPAVIVAFFAMLTVNQALEGWFSDRVSRAVAASEAAAVAYKAELERGLATDTRLIANVLNFEKRNQGRLEDGELRILLERLTPQIQRPVKEIFIVNNLGALRVRGPGSYEFYFDTPTVDELTRAADELVLITDIPNGEIRSLVRLEPFLNHYLYLGRAIDADLLELLNETTATAQRYQQLETERGQVLFDFALLYLAFAVILILAATWVGLLFAERLARPIGRLTAAAQRVGAGDLDVRVESIDGDDEIAMLGRYFNQMTHQLRGQRDRLVATNEQTERRRRLFDSVLSSVTSGVIGLDLEGRITFVNRSAQRALLIKDDVSSLSVRDIVPEFVPLLNSLSTSVHDVVQGDLKLVRAGKQENLLVRISTREAEDGSREGFVIAFEDVTDLVSAQRLAAWGDVARRIAHEIKNPLTPIQLSAERLRRKYAPLVGAESDQLENLTQVIVRQTNDLRRIVDDFSRFARMPEPDRMAQDVSAILQDAVLLQESGFPNVRFKLTMDSAAPFADVDATLFGQALTNLLKNAGESVTARTQTMPLPAPEVRVVLQDDQQRLKITISDNGLGLPEDRAKLFEPYVTHREGGTGLGLPIVMKIIEDHGGGLTLKDAEPFGIGQKPGAMAEIVVQRTTKPTSISDKQGTHYG